MPTRTSADDVPTFQERFHERWQRLIDPHVRALAWLIDAPGLLDSDAPQWQGRIARLGDGADAGDAARAWLHGLERAPAALHAHLALQPSGRLGRYAEKLMTFYLQHLGVLAAHNVQVRSAANQTLGEFDFLVWRGDELLHWEFATKFYLLEEGSAGEQPQADYFVGPNLADSLGAKMDKIFSRQLALSSHPAAQPLLPQPVAAAEALVKGWLFYPDGDYPLLPALGVCASHCRGFWCSFADLPAAPRYAVLPRLSWLGPALLSLADTLERDQLESRVAAHFETDSMPVMVALLRMDGQQALEVDRGFIVPDGWRQRAEERVRTKGALT